MTLRYGAEVILDATVEAPANGVEFRALVDTADGAVTQVLKWTALEPGRVALTGMIRGSAEAFPCEADPRHDALRLVRNSVGLSYSLLNRAVYDRHGDWTLSVDYPAITTIAPRLASSDSTTFELRANGGEVALRFRPRFYQRHRGLREFRPWTYQPWRPSVAGWSSWYAFFDSITERDVKRTADVLGSVLAPYGYEYLQIDDGYQRTPVGLPEHWLQANAKFPAGLGAVRRYIAQRGLAPGIWTNVSFFDSAYARGHPSQFVLSPNEGVASGNWIGFILDGSNPTTLSELVRSVYDSLARMGWAYVKLDALRHLRYEGYNSHALYFTRRGLDRAAVFRSVVQAVRDALGPRTFLLACWGIRPELAGLVDGVRVGTDGFGYGAFDQYNSFNNVVWRNDPDHIQLTAPDAYRAASLTSLTGSVLMLTDRPEVYRTTRVEIAKRTAPVLFTRPEQLYDVDPSRSSRIADADVAVSGSGPRPLDADKRVVQPLYLLDVNRPFEHWTVLARTGVAADTGLIRFSDLGLSEEGRHLVFEFWSKRLLGSFGREFSPGPVDARFGVQLFCIRAEAAHPQVVATNRHVSCGGPDLKRVAWDSANATLEGVSTLVGHDEYRLYLREPAGYRFTGATVTGGRVLGAERVGRGTRSLRILRLRSDTSAAASWHVRWTRARVPGAT